MKFLNVDLSSCPLCGYMMNAAATIGEDSSKPQPGDYSLCLKCGAVLIFDTTLDPRMPTQDELIKLVNSTAYPAVAAIREQIRKRIA